MKPTLTSVTTLMAVLLALTGCAEFGNYGYSSPDAIKAPKQSGGFAAKPISKPSTGSPMSDDMSMPFSTPADIAYAEEIWSAMQADEFVGPGSIITNPYEGTQPHGEILEINHLARRD